MPKWSQSQPAVTSEKGRVNRFGKPKIANVLYNRFPVPSSSFYLKLANNTWTKRAKRSPMESTLPNPWFHTGTNLNYKNVESRGVKTCSLQSEAPGLSVRLAPSSWGTLRIENSSLQTSEWTSEWTWGMHKVSCVKAVINQIYSKSVRLRVKSGVLCVWVYVFVWMLGRGLLSFPSYWNLHPFLLFSLLGGATGAQPKHSFKDFVFAAVSFLNCVLSHIWRWYSRTLPSCLPLTLFTTALSPSRYWDDSENYSQESESATIRNVSFLKGMRKQ